MIDPDARLLAAELDFGQLIEWLVLAALYFLLPAVSERLRRKKAERDAEAHEERPDFEAAETWEPEPPPPSPMSEAEPVQAPRPPEAARRPLEAPGPVAAEGPAVDRLEAALGAWREVAEPRVGRVASDRLAQAASDRVPAWGAGRPWTPEDVDEAGELAGLVEDLTAAVRAVSHPAERLQWRTAEAMLRPLVRQATPATERAPSLVPVGRPVSSEVDALAAEADLVSLPIPAGVPAPGRRVAALEEATARVVMNYPRALDAVVGRALERLVEESRQRGTASRLLRVLLRQDLLGSLLASGVVSAIVFRHTGPLAVLSEPSLDASTQSAHGLRAALARRAANRSGLVPDAGPGEEPEALAWDRAAAALEGAMADVSWGAESGPGLWGLVPAWGPSDDQRAEGLRDALAAHRRDLGTRPSAAAALVAWRLAVEQAGVPLDLAGLRRLADRVEGLRPLKPRAAPTPSLAAGADREVAERSDALVLQILLGAPRGRRHPAFRAGPRPMWRTGRRERLSPPSGRRG